MQCTLTFQVYRYNNGQKKEKEEKCEPEDYSMKRRAEDETKTREEQQHFVVPKKRKLQRPMRNSCYGYSQTQFMENSDDESEVDFRTSNGERISRDGIVFSPPRMIRRLQDYTDNTDSNASLSSDETYRLENIKTEDHTQGESSSHIHDRYRVPLGADTGHSSEFDHNDPLHINITDDNPEDADDTMFERRSRSTMLLTSNFQNIVRDQREEGGQTERCTSTEVTSTKPDEILLNSNDTAATSPASDNDDEPSPTTHVNEQPNSNNKSSPSMPHSAQFDHVTTSASIDNILPKLAEATTSPHSSDILRIADSNMNYQAATASILQTPFSLAQSLAYPYMSLPFLQYNLPQTLMALTPPVNSLPAVTIPNITTVQNQPHASPKGQSAQSPTNQQSQQPQVSPSNSESWDRAISCRECGKMLKSERMLELHMNTAHTHKTVYPCKQCGKIFYAASSLHSHKKRTHTSLENKFKCPNCVRFYAFQSELLRHIDTAHMPISRAANSNSTSQLGSSRSLLTYNNAPQVAIQPKFQNSTAIHSETVKQEIDQNVTINHINGVKREDNTEDSPDSDYRFKCQQCGQMLKSRECLNLHINAKHTQKHAYPCSYCDKVFYAPSSRFCHVRRVHASKEQKFCCDYCDKVCTFHYELRNHIKLSHKDKAVPDPMLPDSATSNIKEVAEANAIAVEGGEHG